MMETLLIRRRKFTTLNHMQKYITKMSKRNCKSQNKLNVHLTLEKSQNLLVKKQHTSSTREIYHNNKHVLSSLTKNVQIILPSNCLMSTTRWRAVRAWYKFPFLLFHIITIKITVYKCLKVSNTLKSQYAQY